MHQFKDRNIIVDFKKTEPNYKLSIRNSLNIKTHID
jgi:hypothetical protein